MSSTNTLTIKVCGCDVNGALLSCNAEAYILNAGLSTGALIAILACIVILLGKGSPGATRRKGLSTRRPPFQHMYVPSSWEVCYTLWMQCEAKKRGACLCMLGYGWGSRQLGKQMEQTWGRLGKCVNCWASQDDRAEDFWGH